MNRFYREYLDEVVERRGTNCIKWDYMERSFGRGDLMPAWVADMDFRTLPAIREALIARAEHAIYGYTDNTVEEKAAVVGWLKRRHGLDVDPDWILYSPGVIDSMFFCVRALTQESDSILIQPPVYGPFYQAVNLFGRTLVKNPLRRTENGWEMDYEDMEAKFARGVKMMILCSPHNPIGRVWRHEELQRVVDLANRYNVVVVADEIHADFVVGDHPQVRILSLENSDNCVMLTSATKSFNLAGLRQSSCIIRNPELRGKVAHQIELGHAGTPNIFGAIAQTVAYNEGDEWMDAVIEYIRENRDYAVDFLSKNLPQIKAYPQEGTYLMWLDFRALGMTHQELTDMLVNEAHVALNSGLDFGKEGECHFRLNLASPRSNIEKVMENINKTIRSRKP